MAVANPAALLGDKPQNANSIEDMLQGVSLIEQYCHGVATVDYAIAHLKAQGKGKRETAQTIAMELIEKFPNEPPHALQYMVGVLTYDLYEYVSLDLNTLIAWHFNACMEGMSTGQGMKFADPRLKQNLLHVIACEAPGTNLHKCLIETVGLNIPKRLRNGDH